MGDEDEDETEQLQRPKGGRRGAATSEGLRLPGPSWWLSMGKREKGMRCGPVLFYIRCCTECYIVSMYVL